MHKLDETQHLVPVRSLATRVKAVLTRFYCKVMRHKTTEDVVICDSGYLRSIDCRTCERRWWR